MVDPWTRHKNTSFSEKDEREKFPPGCCRGGFASALTPLGPLVVALESFHHKQLAQILRGKLLHVLAVVVDLPCWRGNDMDPVRPHDSNTNTETPRTQSEMAGGHKISGDQVAAGGEEKPAA